MNEYIVKKTEPIESEEKTVITIRVTKNQELIFKEWCKKNRIVMTETFSNCIDAMVIGEYMPQMIENPSKIAKYGKICIRTSLDNKIDLNDYCDINGIKLGSMVFTIVNDLMEGKLL